MKLIIDIDEKIVQQAKHFRDIPYDDYIIQAAVAIANGIPFDDIKAEIEQEYKNESEHPYGQGLRRAIEIIDRHIGERSKE